MQKNFLNALKDSIQFTQLCKKKNEILDAWKAFKNKDVEEIWACVFQLLNSHTTEEKLIFSSQNSTLLFKVETDRHVFMSCIYLVSSYIQYLGSNEKKRKGALDFDSNFKQLFNKMMECQFQMSEKSIRLQFGKCLQNICELNLVSNVFTEHIKVHVILFLLWKSCSEEGKTTDISKLKKYQDFCKYIEWNTATKSTVSIFLLSSYALTVPQFYENSDGKNFLSFIWSQHKNIACHMFNRFVKNIPELSLEDTEHYSQIFYFAWKNCPENMINVIEKQIEDIVHFSLKCSLKIASLFRHVLSLFHSNKGDKDVNDLIFRIYDPIIWRTLMSPNWKIRFNGVCIFQFIFPVVDPSIKDINYQEGIEKAYTVLVELAEDPNSCVRQAIARCICYILNELWEIINESRRQLLLNILINRLLKDKFNENVKLEVVLGLNDLSKNKKINKMFIKLFDKLKYLIVDKNVNVRKIFAQLVVYLNEHIDHNFSKEIDLSELIKRISKDYFSFSVHTCIKKLAYLKYEDHQKIRNNDICEYLTLACHIITHSMWKCDIKEQAKFFLQFLNEYPVLMICASKYSDRVKISDRYKLGAVLFEIVNFKLREEDNYILLSKNDPKELRDNNIRKKYIRYSSLLICIANFLKARNDDEIEFCNTDEIQEFLKNKFDEKYFSDSINTVMQPFYFKVLKYVNLNHDNYLVIHNYCHNELNLLHTYKNKTICEKCIIPLLYKWDLLNEIIEQNFNYINACINSIFDQAEKIRATIRLAENFNYGENSLLLNNESNIIKEHLKKKGIEKTKKGKQEEKRYGIDEKNQKKERDEKERTDGTENITRRKRAEESLKDFHYKHVNTEEELKGLMLLCLLIKKKKYHTILFLNYHEIIYNLVYKCNYFFLYTFEILVANSFCLPSQFFTDATKKENMNIKHMILTDKNKLKLYMQMYISYFLLFLSHCYLSDLDYNWEELHHNVSKTLYTISFIRFKNEIDIISEKKRKITKGDTLIIEEKEKWSNYIEIILLYLMHFVDLIEYLTAVNRLSVEDIYVNDFIKNFFLFYKCFAIVNENEEEIKKMYFKVWSKICSFLGCLLNFQYFQKKLSLKLEALNIFFLFTYSSVPVNKLYHLLKNCFLLVKEKETFKSFLERFEKEKDRTKFMTKDQIEFLMDVIQKVLQTKPK